ncbi:MAG: hypothetical protein ACLT0E_06645 [Eubacterium sp.]|uniref:hypothetical protein n=1 Tax=Eubacterium sp. TaxID=142586 RepID=UPI0015B04060|nr:hypothetical protein [Clostridiales bacterium]MEE0175577.1 hypothetical protein [Eubacterium sp.]
MNNKTAVLYMNLNTKKEYNLDNVYKFGSQEFLPLAQMMALLKASLTIKDNKMRIVNSGYTLADADYAMSKMATKLSLANYGINDVIDDIYGGSETAYMASSVLGYFGATVYGLRLSKLDFITKLGDFKEYESFIESCVTNNSNYIDALTTNADMVNRFNTAYNLNKDVNDHSKTLKDVTSVIKDVSEPVKDTSMSNALLWVDARDWNAVFDTISSITNVADYYLKFGSMCEDNKNMINQVESRSSVGDNGVPLHLAIESVQKKYGQDLVKSVTSEIGQELADKVANKAKKIVLEKVIPSTVAISIVSKVFKAAGFDIASDSDYSIMIDLNAKNMLFNDYSSLESSLKYQNANQTEKYRLSAIFYLQACEKTFKNAEKLAKKHELGGNFYKSQIEKVDSVLNLYYLAGQSKSFDNFDDIDNIINNNKSEIINSDIINKATTISQDELNNLSGQKTNWGTLNNVNIEKYEVSDNTKYETEVLGYEGGGSIAVFVNFDKINNVEGFDIVNIWSNDNYDSKKVSVKDKYCSNKCILFNAQEFPNKTKIRAYKTINGKSVYGPYMTINLNSAKENGNLYYDEYESLCGKQF